MFALSVLAVLGHLSRRGRDKRCPQEEARDARWESCHRR